MAQQFTSDNFEAEVLNSDQPVLVDFWAEWCGPCKQIGPIIDALATEVDGKAKVGKVDVSAEAALAAKYNVSSIPALLIFKGGEIKESLVGSNHTQDSLREKLEALA